MPSSYVTVTETAPYTHTQHYECAAWYKNSTAVPGVYEISPTPEKLRYIHGDFTANMDAVITEDYFQSLYCGTMIGQAYDRGCNAGKADRFVKVWSGKSILTDPNVTLSPEHRALAIERALYWASITSKVAREGLERDPESRYYQQSVAEEDAWLAEVLAMGSPALSGAA